MVSVSESKIAEIARSARADMIEAIHLCCEWGAVRWGEQDDEGNCVADYAILAPKEAQPELFKQLIETSASLQAPQPTPFREI